MKRCRLALLAWMCMTYLSLPSALALTPVPTPSGISGFVFELDGLTQVDAGTRFSINNTNANFFIQGATGRGDASGKYVATVKGSHGDIVIIRAWNDYHMSHRTITLQGVMRDVNILLNTTPYETGLRFNSTPVTEAVTHEMYVYDADVYNPSGSKVRFSKVQGPDRMFINSRTGLVKWLPRKHEVGDHNVVLKATNRTHTVYQEFTIHVYLDAGDVPPAQHTSMSSDSAVTGVELATASEERTSVTTYDKRPDQVDVLQKRVYQYVDISPSGNQSEATIYFKVKKSWLEQNSLQKENIVLSHYTEGGWVELPTEIIDEDGEYVYYAADTPGFSFFAISVDREADLDAVNDNLNTYTVSRPTSLDTFTLTGLVYYHDRQVPVQTQVILTNQRTSEQTKATTGIGSDSGAFAVFLYALPGDSYTLEIGSPAQLVQHFDLNQDPPYEFRFKSTAVTKMIAGAGSTMKALDEKQYMALALLVFVILAILIAKRRYQR